VVGSQASAVHSLPSSQDTGVKTHPAAGSQVSVVQGSWSVQTTAVCTQAPVAGSQASVVHGWWSSQLMAGPGTQLPWAVHVGAAWHLSGAGGQSAIVAQRQTRRPRTAGPHRPERQSLLRKQACPTARKP